MGNLALLLTSGLCLFAGLWQFNSGALDSALLAIALMNALMFNKFA